MTLNIQEKIDNVFHRNPGKIEILAAFFNMIPGAVYRLAWVRKVKMLKAYSHCEILKHCACPVRAGLNYDNMGAVIAGRDNGTLPEENQGLPWGEWEVYPRVILHNDENYLRFYTAPENFGKPSVYFVDLSTGNEITRASLQDCASKSEWAESQISTCFTLKLETLVSLERI